MLDTLVAAVGAELADAIAIALALDPRDRYQTAREMGRAIDDGARGISPGEPADSARSGGRVGRAGPDTAATSLLATAGSRGAERRGGAAAGAVTPRRPRQGPPRHQAPIVAPSSASSASSPAGRRRGRLLPAILVLLTIAVVIVAVVIATAPAPTKVVLRNVVYSDVQQASSALKQLVSENTK